MKLITTANARNCNASLLLLLLLLTPTISGSIINNKDTANSIQAENELKNLHQNFNEQSKKAAKLLKLVVFSFDGFRHDYVNAANTPNLWALAQDGVRGHMKSTMVTKTYPNHQSIVTGLYQPYHGIMNNEFIDPAAPPDNTGHPGHFDVDSPSSFWWDMNNASVPLYIANQLYEPEVRFSGAMQWPGSIASYTDGTNSKSGNRTRVHYLQDYDKLMDWHSRVDVALDWLTSPSQPANVAFIYLPEPDSTAHEFGPFSSQVLEQVRRLDDLVGYFRRQLAEKGLSGLTNVIFLSDHGMSEIRDSAASVFHIEQCEQKLFPGLRFRMYGVSPVYSLVAEARPAGSPPNVSKVVAVRDALNRCSERLFSGNFKVYLSNEVPGEFHYAGNRRLLDLFLVAEDGHEVIVGDNGGWRPKGWPVWGNHGYNASAASMRPLFVAQGPRFRSGAYQHSTLFENVDLYPLMLHLVGIPLDRFPSHNGTFGRVKGMLSKTLYDVDGNDYVRHHLASKDQKSEKLVHLLIYIGIGFAVIFTLGICLVLTAGFSGGGGGRRRKSSRTITILGDRANRGNGNGLRDPEASSSGFLRALFGRFQRQSSFVGLRGQHYNCQYTPQRHLDSSFDTEEEEEEEPEDELFSQSTTQLTSAGSNRQMKKKPPRRTPDNDITEVDWEIMGTGLDIDLASQLAPSVMRNGGASRSYRDNSLSSSQSSSASPGKSNQQSAALSYQKLNNKEFTSLLISEDEEIEDQELVFPSNGKPANSVSSKLSGKSNKYPSNGKTFATNKTAGSDNKLSSDDDDNDEDSVQLNPASKSTSNTQRLIDFP